MLLLTACSFDFSSFHGAGGASGSTATSTTGVGPFSSTTAQGSSTLASTSVSTATSTSSSTGAGGAPGELPPCGGITDTFSTFDANVWSSVGTVGEESSHLKVQIASNAGNVAQAFLKTSAQFDECYATVVVVDYQDSALASLVVEDKAQFEGIGYDATGKRLVVSQMLPFDPGAPPDGLGIAFHAGQVYFLYHLSGSWKAAQHVARALWMNDGPNDTIGVAVGPGMNNDQASFDDFNVNPIKLADL